MSATDGVSNIVRSPFVLVPQHFGSTVFNRSTSKYMPFDQQTTRLLLRLRSDSFDRVLAENSNLELRHQLIRFFEDFYRLGFFTIEGKFLGAVLDVHPPQDHLVGPLAVHLEVETLCNLKCKHCFAGELPRRENVLTINELNNLFQTLAGMGTFRLGLTGGEPLLRRDIFDIIDLATEHGLHPCLTTNGLLITKEIAREFGKRDLVWLNVSLEGATKETNDSIRGNGTFERVMDRLTFLSELSRFTLAFTITRSNWSEIEQCAELAYRVGAHAAVFRPLYPVGMAAQNMDLMPTFFEYNMALNALTEYKDKSQFELCTLDPFSPNTRKDAQAVTHEDFRCGAGNQVCSISYSGDVSPCSFLGADFIAANIRQEPFTDIWHSNRMFQSLRTLPSLERPAHCDDDVFSGGCRARALAYNGSVNAPDPWLAQKWAGRGTEAIFGVKKSQLYHPLTILEVTK